MISVTVIRPNGTDKYGNPIAGDTRFTVTECAVAPRQDPETDAGVHDTGRQGVIVGLTLYAPFGADIHHDDLIELPAPWQGPWEVEGEPGNWENPFTNWAAGLEVALRRAAG